MLGRRKLGDILPIAVLTRTAIGAPSMPDAPPICYIFDADGNKVATVKLPPADRYVAPGLFQLQLFLGSTYAVGLYRISMHFTIGGAAGVEEETFEIMDGGDATGTIVSLAWYHCPMADFLLQQLNSGQIVQGRNPYL